MKLSLGRCLLLSVGFAVVALVGLVLWALSADSRGRWLCRAAWENDTDTARLLVRLGTDANFEANRGPALHGAAHNGNTGLMRFLIAHGANVDGATKFGVTPLWEARSNRRLAAEQLLLARGANPDTSRIDPP